MENKKKILVGALLVLLVVTVIYSYQKTQSRLQPAPTQRRLTPTPVIPTLSPEKREIISKTQTHKVTIANRTFSPQSLTIKRHDQVQWENKDNEAYQIKGDGWESPPIRPGRNFTQTFKEVGTFPYSCALHPEVEGTITVTE